MGLRIIQSASFRSLLDELMGRVIREAGSDPWTPRWVLTPTATVAARLRVRLAAEAGERSLGNLRVLPLSRLVNRLCETLFGNADLRWSPFLDLLLLDLLENGPDEIVPEPLRKTKSNYRLLVRTLLDLADAGFGPEQADPLLEVASEADVGELTRKTLRFHVAWTQLLTTAGHGWQPLQQARLIEWIRTASEPEVDRALGAEEGAHPEAFLYGFYDFTDLNLELIAGLASRIAVEAYLPGADRAGFDFANAVCRELAIRARDIDLIQLPPSDPVTDFLLSSFPPGRPPEAPPAFLSRQRVSSRFAEALSAAVRVVTWCEGPEAMRPHEILIAAPDLEPYAADLRRAFEDFRIPLSLIDLDVSQDGQGRPLRMLRRIWEDRAPAEWVLGYLREYPELTRRREVDLDGFEKKVRTLGLGGGQSWRILHELAESGSALLSSAGVELTEAERRLVEDIVRAWVDGSRLDQPLPASSAAALLRLLSDWLPHPELLESVTEQFETFGRLRPSTRLAPEMVWDIALESVPPDTHSDPIDGPGVVAASIMRARGLTARGVILLGLSADAFPRRVEEDTLLPDASRALLMGKAGALGHRLAKKGQVLDEMALLFLLLNASADRIHWVIPETDDDGKAVAPTPWVQHYLHRWIPEDGMWRRIPRGPADQARWLYRLDPKGGTFLPPAHAVYIEASGIIPQEAGDAPDSAPEPRRKRQPSGQHGMIADSAAGPAERVLSVTRLERLARCPFRYWAEAGVRLRTLEPLTPDGRLGPLERGSLLHACLEEVTRSCREKGLPVSTAVDSLADLWEKAADAPPFLQTAFLPPVLARAVRWEMERMIRAYFLAVADGRCRDGVPLRTESRFERRVEGTPHLTLTGKMDRIDLRGDRRHIVDYKSGRNPFGSRLAKSQDFQLGFFLQPLLYPWLLGVAPDAGHTRFSYVFLGGDQPQEVEIEFAAEPDEVLGGLLQTLEIGAFVPTSNEAYGSVGLGDAKPCAMCDFVSFCRRFDVRSPARSLESLGRLAPRRFQQILAVRRGRDGH